MAHIDRRTTASGVRYEVRYRAPDGKERSRTFRTRRDADRFAVETAGAVSRGSWIDPRSGNRTLADVAAEWLESNPAKRGTTWARDESIIRVHLNPAIGDCAIGTMTPVDVAQLVKRWNAELAPRSVRRTFGTLKAILNYAVDTDVITRSPADRVKLPTPRTADRPLISPAQVVALAEAIGPDYSAMVYLGAVLGLRRGECAGLRVRNIDFAASTVTIEEQLTRGRAGQPEIGPPKSEAGRRTLSAPAALLDLLKANLDRQGLTGDHDAHVLTSPDGELLAYQNWRVRVFTPAAVKAGVPSVTFHDLRRLNATVLVTKGVDVKTAQKRLGHSDIRMTLEVYARSTSAADRNAADVVGARFLGASPEL